jgi:hypothetical protein
MTGPEAVYEDRVEDDEFDEGAFLGPDIEGDGCDEWEGDDDRDRGNSIEDFDGPATPDY